MNNKKHIDIYKTIYNLDIIVANKYVTMKDLNKTYKHIDDSDLTEDDDSNIATTYLCKNRNTNDSCILVKYHRDYKNKNVNKRLELVNTASHEAIHVVMAIYDFIGEKVYPGDNNELLAYLTGWVTKCIYDTWTKK